MDPSGVITLTTDFGLTDAYAGIMRGVILSINPRSVIADVTHHIPPQDIAAAGFALATACDFFPAGTVHVAVVDPGVGGPRRPLLIVTDRYFFVGPDNGIFSLVLSRRKPVSIFTISNPRYCLPRPSMTFHARDIFAPVAAHLSRGVAPADLGDAVHDCLQLRLPAARVNSIGEVQGEVVHIDRFGNLITNLSQPLVKKAIGEAGFVVKIKEVSVTRHVETYACADEHELVSLYGSSNMLEISVRNGSAREYLQAARGDKVTIRGC